MHMSRSERDGSKGNKNKDKHNGLARVIEEPTLVCTHLGNPLLPTKSQKLITFLVE